MEIIEVANATVEFTKSTQNDIVTYKFDTSAGGHPMVNAMAGLAILKENEQLIMINHCPPMGLFPKIEAEFEYSYNELDNGLTEIIFIKRADASTTTDFTSTSCSGGCG